VTIDDDRDELSRQIDDLTELKNAMLHRHTLKRFSPEWREALTREEGLIERIRAWSHPTGMDPE
jgi:hypothetical protein